LSKVFERVRCRLRTSCRRECRSDAFGTFGSPESFAYCVAETVRSKTARGKPRPGLGNLHSAGDRVEPGAFAEHPHRAFLCIKRRTAEVIVDGNLFDPGIDRRGIKPRLRIIGTWEPSVRSAML
jgi:hypothetical protein